MATITSDGKMPIQQDHESREMSFDVPSESSPEPTAAPITPESLLVTRLPADVRFLIYDTLMSQKHEIEYCTWSPYLCNPSILGPLQASCTSIRQEIDAWYEHKTKSKAGLLRNAVFGIFNPETTSFWKRIFPCNVNEVMKSGGFLSQDKLQNYPVDLFGTATIC